MRKTANIFRCDALIFVYPILNMLEVVPPTKSIWRQSGYFGLALLFFEIHLYLKQVEPLLALLARATGVPIEAELLL